MTYSKDFTYTIVKKVIEDGKKVRKETEKTELLDFKLSGFSIFKIKEKAGINILSLNEEKEIDKLQYKTNEVIAATYINDDGLQNDKSYKEALDSEWLKVMGIDDQIDIIKEVIYGTLSKLGDEDKASNSNNSSSEKKISKKAV